MVENVHSFSTMYVAPLANYLVAAGNTFLTLQKIYSSEDVFLLSVPVEFSITIICHRHCSEILIWEGVEWGHRLLYSDKCITSILEE